MTFKRYCINGGYCEAPDCPCARLDANMVAIMFPAGNHETQKLTPEQEKQLQQLIDNTPPITVSGKVI